MHEGGALRDIAERWRFKGMRQGRHILYNVTASIIIAFQADIVKPIIGKAPASMTDRALGFGVKQREAFFSLKH